MKTTIRVGTSLVALILATSACYGITRTLSAVRDNTLFEDDAAANARSNGAGSRIFAGRTAQGTNSIRRALVAFDLAGAAIPSGATITSAELRLQMNMTNAGGNSVALHRVAAAWGEGGSLAGGGQGGGAPAQTGDATWFHTFFPSALWSVPGGDFNPTPSASQIVGDPGAYTWGSTAQMVADVQSWVDNPASNFGWILVGNEFTQPTAKSFDSRESGSGPELVVTFNAPVPASGPWTLLALALVLALAGASVLRLRPVAGRTS